MATFKFGRAIDLHWNGYDIQGPAETVFSIPDQLYEEFDADIAPVEPTLVWLDTNEFLTLSNSVSVTTLESTFPISVTTTTSGRNVSISSSTNPAGYTIVADGTGGVIFQAGSTGALTSVVGVSPISAIIAGNAASVSIDQSLITGATAATNAQVVRFLVKNTTGTTIPKGSAVYVSGATGDNALISLASATSDPSSSKTLGITAEAIATDAFGYVIEAGYLTDIDTSATTAGAAVWLGNTPGSLVFVSPPAEPSHAVYLGVVVRVQAINGSILVKVQNGYELDELHDVSAASPTDLDILQYKSSSSLWTKASISNAGIAASVHTHDYQASGTYVNSVIGTSPASVSTSSGTSTVSIIASSIDSSHLADNAVVAAKIAAGSVGTVAISSGSATSGQVLTANGSGGVSFSGVTASSPIVYETLTGTGTWTRPSGVQFVDVTIVGAGGGGGGGPVGFGMSGESQGGGGAGGASGSVVAVYNVYVGDQSSIAYSAAAGGTGGAAGASYSTAAGVDGTTTNNNGSSGGIAAASNFGIYASTKSSAGGGGGTVVASATAPAAATGGVDYIHVVEIDYGFPSQSKGGNYGTDGGATTPASVSQDWYVNGIVITNKEYIGNSFGVRPGVWSTGGASGLSASISGNVPSASYSVGIGGALHTANTDKGPSGGGGGGNADSDVTPLGRTGSAYTPNGGGGGGAVSVYITSGASITATLAAGAGGSPANYFAGGGGGAGAATMSTSTNTVAKDAQVSITGASGGKGSDAAIYLRYIR